MFFGFFMLLTYEQEMRVIERVLRTLGAQQDEALATAAVLSEADVRGLNSHGIMRLPYIVRGVKRGTIRLDVRIAVTQEHSSTALIDGNHGLGHYVASEAMRIAIRKAKLTGIGAVGVHQTNHFGIAGYYAELAMSEGMVGVVMTTTDAMVHPFGGIEAMIGTNALAVGVPHSHYPVLLDMATSAAARGKIVAAVKLGKKIPIEWAIDPQGHPTSDPTQALAGALSSFGGIKGYGLALIIALLAGPLVHAAAGRRVRGSLEPSEFCTKGDLMMAVDPTAFVSRDEFERNVSEFLEDIKSSKKAPGFSEILLPGEPEYRTRERQLKEGIEIPQVIWNEIVALSEQPQIDLERLINAHQEG